MLREQDERADVSVRYNQRLSRPLRAMSKCNVCWEPLNGTLSVAPCGHCFCTCPCSRRDATHQRAAARSQRLAAAAPRAHWLRVATALLSAGLRADARRHSCSRVGDQHAEAVLEQCEGCPQCGGPISNQTLKVVPVDPQEAIVKVRGQLRRASTSASRLCPAHALAPQTALYGLCPENIIKAAHAGFSWWIDQTGRRHARR